MTHRAWKWRRRRQLLRVLLSTAAVVNPWPISWRMLLGSLESNGITKRIFTIAAIVKRDIDSSTALLAWDNARQLLINSFGLKNDRRRRSEEHKRNRKENCWGWRRTNEWMKSPQMKFYKLSLTQQRNSFYASNVPRFTFLRVSFFLSPLQPFVNNKHTNTDGFAATCEGTRNSSLLAIHTRRGSMLEAVIDWPSCGRRYDGLLRLVTKAAV